MSLKLKKRVKKPISVSTTSTPVIATRKEADGNVETTEISRIGEDGEDGEYLGANFI